jgi:hypothetical protein
MNDIKADLETLKAMSKYFRDSAFIPWADALDRAIAFIEAAKTAPADEVIEGLDQLASYYDKDTDTHKMLRKANEMLIAAVSVDWVSVEDRLPDAAGWYLISTALGHVSDGFYRPDKGFRRGEGEVVAWRPLPQPYKRIDSPKETK